MSDWERRPPVFPGEWLEEEMLQQGQLTEGSIEQEIKNKRADKGQRLTPQDIDGMVSRVEYWRVPRTTTMVCCIITTSGFTVLGKAACVSAVNYDENIGKKIAYDNAREKIWELEGYRLNWLLHDSNRYAITPENSPIDDGQLDLGF